MITFYKLGTYGRLGNQFFQYAALKSLAIKNNYKLKILSNESTSWHGQKFLLPEFNLIEEQMHPSEMQYIKNFYEESPKTDYSFFSLPDNTNINGFFQHRFYFEDILYKLKEIFTLKQSYIDKAKEEFKEIQKYRNNNKIISVHIRLGDIIRDNSLYYSNTKFIENLTTYLEKAINSIGSKNDFFIFTGGSRCQLGQEKNDIEICKFLLKNINANFIFSEGNDTLIDFQLMRMCDDNILSPLSTYSLWVGYLAESTTNIGLNILSICRQSNMCPHTSTPSSTMPI